MEQKNLTYYQPQRYYDNGVDVRWGDIPEELMSFMAFTSREDAEKWLEDNGYDPKEFCIFEYHDDDIEGVTLLNADGEFVDGTGSASAYKLGEDLDREQSDLEELIGDRTVEFKWPVMLYEEKNDLLEYDPDMSEDERWSRAEIKSVDRDSAYDVDGTVYPLGNIVDFDDIYILRDAVERSSQQ